MKCAYCGNEMILGKVIAVGGRTSSELEGQRDRNTSE